jgi:hypothetical protein
VSLIARFESFIERLMEHSFTRATGSHLQPVEIGKRVVRSMESAQRVGMDGVLVPNVYNVYLSPPDYDHYKAASASLAREVESHLGRVARQREFTMVARPLVRLDMDQQLSSGDIRVEPHIEDVEAAPERPFQHTAVLPQMDGPIANGPATPSIVYSGKTFAVLRSPTRIGRLPDNDIVLQDRRVSRHHCEVVETSGRWLVRDTGSTNGIAVNGKIVREAALRPGDQISLGGLEVSWEQ